MSIRAYYDGKDIFLTQKEFSLLLVFIQNENITISAERLFELVWGSKLGFERGTLKTRISSLRSRLEDGETGYTIRAVYREGYTFEKV